MHLLQLLLTPIRHLIELFVRRITKHSLHLHSRLQRIARDLPLGRTIAASLAKLFFRVFLVAGEGVAELAAVVGRA